MVFNFEVVAKAEKEGYVIGGTLLPSDDDKELFKEIQDSYSEVLTGDLGTGLTGRVSVEEDRITFVAFDIMTIVNVLKLLQKNLGVSIEHNITSTCRFIPNSCKALFNMEIHKLLA